jgi:hypothetical protein
MNRLLYLIIYIGLLTFIFFGLSDNIIYDNSQDILSWLPFILLFIVQPFLVYKIARTFDIPISYVIAIAALSILVSGPVFGIYLGKKQDKELADHGRTTTGIVYKKWETFRKQRHNEWLLRCNFTVNGKVYSTFSVQDKNNQYKVGDTLHVLYSDTNPQNCIVVELKDE